MQNITYISLTLLLWQFIEAVLVIIVAIVSVFFVDTLTITIIISSHSVAQVYTQVNTDYSHNYIC